MTQLPVMNRNGTTKTVLTAD